ncbi:MAG TPA: ArsA family ATPase [Longimicrobiales bacterium]|nr:ArsA family ATPase [Longimicrobiales bacterium]
MSLPIAGRRLIFVGGKGGVGKTTTAAAVALHLADAGRRALVVSTDPAHSLGDVFETEIGDRPRALAPGLMGLEIDPDAQVDSYLTGVKQSMRQLVHPEMYHEVDRQVELARTSPGAVEAAMLERVAELMVDEHARYDSVVFDTAPTGQTLRLLSLPEIMTAWTEGLIRHREKSDQLANVLDRVSRGAPQHERGDDLSRFDQHSDEPSDPRFAQVRETLLRRRRTFQRARRLLLDPEVTAFVLVLIPERLPVLETAKAARALARFEIPLAGLVVNRILPEGPLGPFLEERREQEQQYLARIEEEFRHLPQIRVPLFARDVGGLDALREVARHLFAGESVPERRP